MGSNVGFEIAGRRFGHWLVIGRASGRCMWACVCDCGTRRDVMSSNLTSGKSSGCGCVRNAETVARSTKHGFGRRKRKTAEYRAWQGAISRVAGHFAGYEHVRMCKRWRESFTAFLEDMGRRPDGLSIDRIDNGGHYSCGKCEECVSNGWPANCRWATATQQSQNRRTVRWIEHNGVRLTLTGWSERLGICKASLDERLRKWPLERALTEEAHR